MLYSVVSPFDTDGELHEFLTDPNNDVIDKEDTFYADLMAEKNRWNIPKRLVAKDARSCTMCHAIGNADYSVRFINALFSMHSLNGKDHAFSPQPSYRFWSRVFVSNVSPVKRSDSYHDKKVKREILPVKVKGESIEKEDAEQEQLSEQRYVKAIVRINKCGREPNDCDWDDHWTVERVNQEPLRYLQDNCSYCHSADMADPVLVTGRDFKSSKNAERIIARLYDTNPMPPSGQLPDSVKGILVEYLRDK